MFVSSFPPAACAAALQPLKTKERPVGAAAGGAEPERKARNMTLLEIEMCGKDFLTPNDVAPVLKVHPYNISLAARDCPETLGFPVCRIGTRTKIPRIPFLRFMGVDR